MMQKEDHRNFFLGTVLVLALASIIISMPFISSVIGGAVLAFVFTPLYRWVKTKTKYESIAAIITVIAIFFIVALPSFFILSNLTNETQELYLVVKHELAGGKIIEGHCLEDSIICSGINKVNSLLREPEIKNYLINLFNNTVTFLTQQISEVILSIPKLALDLFVLLFTTYYLLIGGKDLFRRLTVLIPLSPRHQDQVVQQFSNTTYALIYGSFIVSLVQGTLGAFGFWIFGLTGFVWWGIIMAFLALIPFIGTATIWMPASIWLMLSGYTQGESEMIIRGTGLFLYGLLIISTADNILKPFIISERARVHPLIVLIGVVGGLAMFGLIGLVVGPLVLSLFQTLFEIYEREQNPYFHAKQ